MGPAPKPPIERFYARLVADGDCLIWTGAKDKDGYPMFQLGVGKTVRGHRWWWEQHNGVILNNLLVCHTCDRPACVSLNHLFLGTHADNHADRDNKGRQAQGENHYKAKISDEQVKELRYRVDNGEKVHRIYKEYGLSYSQVKAIAARRSRLG